MEEFNYGNFLLFAIIVEIHDVLQHILGLSVAVLPSHHDPNRKL